MPSKCLVCGYGAHEVEKMHRFPLNDDKSKLWQEMMGIKYEPALLLRNYLICSRHFTADSYANLVTRKLNRNAVPSLLPCQLDSPLERVTIVGTDLFQSTNIDFGESVVSEDQIPSCSGIQQRQSSTGEAVRIQDSVPSTSGIPKRPITTATRRSVFRSIIGLSRADATPRKQHLIRIVESKEIHIRNLKKLCKKRANDIKLLKDIDDSPVMRNIFKDMPSATADFLISQLRCARRQPHGRRWTFKEKVIALALFKRSPRCYSLLRKIVALPSKNTLLELLRKVSFNSGVNDHLFKHIEECTKDEKTKYCVLLFDEMDIKEHVQYDAHSDRIVGFEELEGLSHSKKIGK
ncbi:hypothetical protein NQ317_009548 [Molorchus minor]|uniref:THAP-type domain-containing protein n=1 Tax=Molorchus minor TaxID=1323400 RepID=A0ABQ9J8K2_9CUCU|nr:hypothetical protein NQ317_009548 [Molorchus minor]